MKLITLNEPLGLILAKHVLDDCQYPKILSALIYIQVLKEFITGMPLLK